MDMTSFSNKCGVAILAGKGGTFLVAHCRLLNKDTGKVYNFQKRVDLTPIIEKISRTLRNYHQSLHGHGPISVSGWKSFIKKGFKAAKKIAKSKAVKSLYKKAAPMLSSAVPGGAMTLGIVTKAHDVLVAARKGNKSAVAKIKAIARVARTDPRARKLVGKMKMMNRLLEKRKTQKPLRMLPPPPPPMECFPPPMEEEEEQEYCQEQNCQEPEYSCEDCYGEEVGGWVYHKPYRSVLEASLNPGPMMGLRSMYNKGLGRGALV